MPRSMREAAAAALLALIVAGCAGVPTSGPVRQHDSYDQQVDSEVRVAPVPPPPEASAMLVVEGFLHAMATDSAGFAVARQYLTDSANRAWNPLAGTSIYADGDRPRELEGSTEDEPLISLGGTLTGTLSPAGEYREGVGGLRHDFGLVRDADNQWRISKPPDGLLISRYHFTTNYVAQDLHFLDPAGTALVPDPRFLPQGSALPGLLVRGQLAGPGQWLAPAVRPRPAAVLGVERVDVSPQGIAGVELAPSAAQLSDDARQTLMAEITTTLTQLPQINGVQLIVGSTLLSRPGTTTTTLVQADFADLAPADRRTSAGQLLVVRDQQVRTVQPTQLLTEGEPVFPGLVDPGAIAARSDLSEAATVSPDGTRLSVAGPDSASPTVLFEGRSLLRPDYSRQNELWAIGDRADANGFQVFAGDEHALRPVVATDIPEERVRAFRISPDGARMALVLDGLVVDGDRVEQVGVVRIVRQAEQIRLEGFRPVTVSPPAEAGRRLVDVGWTTATELLVLVSHGTTAGARAESVVRVDQDSASAEDIGPAETSGLRELAVVPYRQAVLRGDGVVLIREGDYNWRPTPVAVDAVTYSG